MSPNLTGGATQLGCQGRGPLQPLSRGESAALSSQCKATEKTVSATSVQLMYAISRLGPKPGCCDTGFRHMSLNTKILCHE